jgi:hypothetical protein
VASIIECIQVVGVLQSARDTMDVPSYGHRIQQTAAFAAPIEAAFAILAGLVVLLLLLQYCGASFTGTFV